MTAPQKPIARNEFLLRMYDQMFNNINRHIMITWEIIPVIGGALGAIALSKNETISTEIGASLIILLGGWFWAHALDANEWVKRNLFVVSNIERHYLITSDEKDVHYFFRCEHKPELLRHFLIQVFSAIAIMLMALVWTFVDADDIRETSTLPMWTFGVVTLLCLNLHFKTNSRQKEFAEKSPGLAIQDRDEE